MIAAARVGITTLAAVGFMCGSGLAMSPYTVHIKLPSTIAERQSFLWQVAGHSAQASQLTVFTDHRPCATTSAREQARPRTAFSVDNVTGPYVLRGNTLHGPSKPGKYYYCAYLTGPAPQFVARVRAQASYTVVLCRICSTDRRRRE
jgi:hypothetical protein